MQAPAVERSRMFGHPSTRHRRGEAVGDTVLTSVGLRIAGPNRENIALAFLAPAPVSHVSHSRQGVTHG